ncbi:MULTISPECIES: sulfotransferase [Gammaproteobacteria]|uniref:sulfotransferase n=1 Tax=Gammaproteobacteria TaxID=1236 RepID=UPI000DCF8519|nr:MULTISPECIES: sulfotransferase [Gammaproteobacteria]RTE86828.1 hypothetical protein DQX04_00075 [Aliidiomarina sp. B3213]TCZ93383.1 hypothetical protein EYQ95_05225 [Lysobacter sp. N42]
MNDKLFILGVQKSGTSAIAGLLGDAFGIPTTLDLNGAISSSDWQLKVKFGLMPFKEFVDSHTDDFNRTIVKEPCLTFFAQELEETFPEAKFLVVLRHPYEVVRSTLQRLKIPAHLESIKFEEWEELVKTKAWRLCLDSTWLGQPSSNYIEALAWRWKISCDLQKVLPTAKFIRYEDFKENREAFISNLGIDLGLGQKVVKALDYNKQYQPKGKQVSGWSDYFGENIKLINRICGENMELLGYHQVSS